MGNTRLYDVGQALAGARRTHDRLPPHLKAAIANPVVLDLGGGTGTMRDLSPGDCIFICLDVDPMKLQGFQRKHPGANALLADGVQVPTLIAFTDAVLCVAVAHHLSDGLLSRVLSESARILKGGGTLIFLDALWEPHNKAGRLLWRIDRGGHPRAAETLESAISESFVVALRDG